MKLLGPIPSLEAVPAPESKEARRKRRLEKHLAIIEHKDRIIERRATSVLEDAMRAPDLVDVDIELYRQTGVVPEGWTKRGLKIAADANLPMKQTPAYIGLARQIKDSYKRAEEKAPVAPVLNAEKVVLQVNNYNYPVKELDEE